MGKSYFRKNRKSIGFFDICEKSLAVWLEENGLIAFEIMSPVIPHIGLHTDEAVKSVE